MITGVIKNQEQKAYKASMEGIIRAVNQDYADDNYLSPRIYYYDNGVLKLNEVNEKERNELIKINGKIKASGYIYVDYDGNIILDYLCSKDYCGYNTQENSLVNVEENDGTHTNINLDTPVIALNGEAIIVVDKDESYQELGAIARTKLGIDISNNIIKTIKLGEEVVSKIDTTTENTYTVEYKIMNEGEEAIVIRTVKVKELTPIISNIASSITDKSIKVTINLSNEGNGIRTYYYSKDGGNSWVSNASSTYTFTNLEAGETYSISTYVVDKAGRKAKEYKENIQTAVARIDNTYYTTLASAIEAVPETNTEKTITLLSNISELVTVTANKKINYVGGNYTLTGQIINYGYLTMTSGRVDDVDNSDHMPLINFSTMIINDGTIISEGKQTIYNYNGNIYINGGTIMMSGDVTHSSVVIKEGTLTITGGTLKSTNIQGACIYVYEGKTATLNGGVIESENTNTIISLGNLLINGATIIGNDAAHTVIHVLETGSLTMESGSVTNTAGGYAIYNRGTATITGGTTSPKNYNVTEE